LNGLNQTLHVRNGSAGTSCRLSTFLGSIRCCKMSTFTLSRCGEAVVAGLVHHETSKVARRVSCGRPQPWGVGRFSAHRASAPLWALDPEMGSATRVRGRLPHASTTRQRVPAAAPPQRRFAALTNCSQTATTKLPACLRLWGDRRFSANDVGAENSALSSAEGQAEFCQDKRRMSKPSDDGEAEGTTRRHSEACPDRSPSLGRIAGAVSGYLKTQGGVSKSQGQCEAY
jgi:hypothetical protein